MEEELEGFGSDFMGMGEGPSPMIATRNHHHQSAVEQLGLLASDIGRDRTERQERWVENMFCAH